MTDASYNSGSKIINPEFARGALHSVRPHGEFKALVKFAVPEQVPQYMAHIELESPGLFRVRIPCAKISHIEEDDNIISVELLERISFCSQPI